MKKKILIVTLILLIGAPSGVFLLSTNNKISTYKQHTNTPSINFKPPTKIEQAAGNAQKDINVSKQTSTPEPSQTANVVVVDAGQYGQTIEVRAFISNLIKPGQCTATFTKGQETITRSSLAAEDATTTQCRPINIDRSSFTSSGAWSLIVSYTSADASGKSNTVNVEVK